MTVFRDEVHKTTSWGTGGVSTKFARDDDETGGEVGNEILRVRYLES